MNIKELKSIRDTYNHIKKDIERRISEFLDIKKSKDRTKTLKELIFCIFTPQSKAEHCWQAVEILEEKGLLEKPIEKEISNVIKGLVRFHNTKSNFVVKVMKKFDEIYSIAFNESIYNHEKRLWIVKNVKGVGFKEATHFLRNIGVMLEDGAIIDRHIIRFLKNLGIDTQSGSSISPKKYLAIEEKFISLARRLNLLPVELDFVIWYKQTGRFFK